MYINDLSSNIFIFFRCDAEGLGSGGEGSSPPASAPSSGYSSRKTSSSSLSSRRSSTASLCSRKTSSSSLSSLSCSRKSSTSSVCGPPSPSPSASPPAMSAQEVASLTHNNNNNNNINNNNGDKMSGSGLVEPSPDELKVLATMEEANRYVYWLYFNFDFLKTLRYYRHGNLFYRMLYCELKIYSLKSNLKALLFMFSFVLLLIQWCWVEMYLKKFSLRISIFSLEFKYSLSFTAFPLIKFFILKNLANHVKIQNKVIPLIIDQYTKSSFISPLAPQYY